MAIEKCIRCEADGISLMVCIGTDGLAIEVGDDESQFNIGVDSMEFAYQLADLINSVRPIPVQENMVGAAEPRTGHGAASMWAVSGDE